MFIPKRRKWSATGTDNVKFTIGLTTASGGTEWRYPVLRKPADTSRPQFGIPKRKVWRQADWSKGWGQLRFDDKSAYWYSTAHTFRDGEISAGAKLYNPTTTTAAAANVGGFAEYGATRVLYCYSGTKLYSYSGYASTEAWAEVNTGASGTIFDLREEGGTLYLSQDNANYYTYDGSTWSDGGSKKDHFCYHDGTIYAAGDHHASPSTAYKVYYGASWANDVDVGGSEDPINAMVSFGNDLIILKSDGLYAIGTKPQDATIAAWEPKVMPIATFATERNANNGKYWTVWNGRLWFNCGTSLAYYDGLDVVMVEYPWSVAPTQLGNIYSMTAMDDCLLVGYLGYVLAYSDKGVGTPGQWQFMAVLPGTDDAAASTSRQPTALWFSRLSESADTASRVWIGLNEIADNTQNCKYAKMYAGLFLPYTFAASSDYYSSWFDDTDQTITKWLMEFYVETDNCDNTGNEVEVYYATDGGTSFTHVYTVNTTDIIADGINKVPTSGYVGGTTLVSFRSLQIKITIKSASGAVSPIVKAIEVVFQPKTPDRRQWDYTILCSDNWEADLYSANTTAEAYRDQLWTLSQQDTPLQFKDEFGDTYTVSLVLVETIPHYADGSVTGVEARIHMEEA